MDEQARWRQRLQRLGGHANRSSPRRLHQAARLQGELPGQIIETSMGPALRIQQAYPPDHRHGRRCLQDLLTFTPEEVSAAVQEIALQELPLEDLLFLDTETTGLAGGAGTLVFLVGLGRFKDGRFELRQYFLREPGEERGMLKALAEELEGAKGFVTFNGRAFDIPLLEMRFGVGMRKRWVLTRWPQLDLLYPSRRLWRRDLRDCSLSSLERHVLSVQRSEEDVAGALIPGLYLDYLRTGQVDGMRRVIYHNAIDVLSLATLMAEVVERTAGLADSLSAGEALGLARWHHAAGRLESAHQSYLAALESEDPAIRLEALRHFTAFLKRAGMREEALEGWQQWHALAPDDPRPCIELAIYYEWHAREVASARAWAEQALLCLSHWPQDWRRERAWQEITHRIERLARKQAAASAQA